MNARAGLLLATVLALAGCTGSLLESKGEAPEAYRLQGEALADRGGRLPVALAVERPSASPALDSERIAVVQPDHRFDYFAGVRWSEPAPEMLQQQLVRALAADGRFAAVVAAPSRVPAELLLDVELRRFEATYAAAGTTPQVRVEMHVSLIEPRQARRVTSFIAAGSATAAANRRASVVEAFELATSEAMRKAVDAVREAVPAPPR
jgi:cholesterol transport system auxiliary component